MLSVQQAKQFGLTRNMKMVIPYQIPFLSKEVGPELTEGVFAATDFWWTLEDKYPRAKMFVDASKRSTTIGWNGASCGCAAGGLRPGRSHVQ